MYVHTYICEYAKDVLPIFLKQKVLDTLTSHHNGRLAINNTIVNLVANQIPISSNQAVLQGRGF